MPITSHSSSDVPHPISSCSLHNSLHHNTPNSHHSNAAVEVSISSNVSKSSIDSNNNSSVGNSRITDSLGHTTHLHNTNSHNRTITLEQARARLQEQDRKHTAQRLQQRHEFEQEAVDMKAKQQAEQMQAQQVFREQIRQHEQACLQLVSALSRKCGSVSPRRLQSLYTAVLASSYNPPAYLTASLPLSYLASSSSLSRSSRPPHLSSDKQSHPQPHNSRSSNKPSNPACSSSSQFAPASSLSSSLSSCLSSSSSPSRHSPLSHRSHNTDGSHSIRNNTENHNGSCSNSTNKRKATQSHTGESGQPTKHMRILAPTRSMSDSEQQTVHYDPQEAA